MDKFDTPIDSDLLSKIGIEPTDGIEYIENKKVTDLNPVHVKALQILKQKPVVASS